MKRQYSTTTEFIKDILPETTKKPKIAIMGAIFSSFDGVSRVIEQQAKELSEGFEVSVVTLEANMEPPKNVRLEVMGSPENLILNRFYRLCFPLIVPES